MARKRKQWSFRLNDTTQLDVSAAPDATRTQVRRRGRWSIVVGMLLAILAVGAVVASADQISNNLDTSIDAVAEVMPLNAGSSGTTQLYVVTANGDGKNGCNLTGSTTLGLSVSSSNTSVATVSPSSVTFGSCGDTKTLTVTAVAVGSATISVSQTSNTTGGTFDLAPATFTVNVTAPPPANTAPHVTVNGVTAGASYEIGSVPSATCEVTDAEDGNSSFAASLSAITGALSTYGLGSQTASCSYTDGGGLTASASATYTIVDTNAPSSSATATSNGSSYTFGDWANHDVIVTLSGSDSGGSGLKAIYYTTDGTTPTTSSTTYSSPFTISNEGTTTVQWFAVDQADNAESAHSATVKVDKTAPQQSSCDSVDGNWHSANVTLNCTYTDSVSGPATQQVALITDVASGVETANASASAGGKQACDNAGNCAASPADITGNKIDRKAPQQTSCDSADGNWHADNVTLHCTYTDGGSGPASQQVALVTNVASGVETANASASANGAQACDAVNNCADSPTDVAGNKIDRKPPTITDGGPTTSPNSNGWYNADVTNQFSASDGGSGLASTCPSSWTKKTSGEGTAVKVASGSCADAVGNSNAGINSAAFQIDKTAPTVTVTGFTDGQKFVKGVDTLPTVGCSRNDLLSDIDASGSTGPTVTAGGLDANGVGSVTYTCGARDNAGNTNSASATYSIVYGQNAVQFLQPINGTAHDLSTNPDVSTFKAGSTVPVKVQVVLPDGTIVQPTSAQWITPQKGSATSQPVDESVYSEPATSGSSYAWNSTGQYYQYNWGTPKTGAGFYWLIGVKLDDNQVYRVYISLR